MVAAPPCRSDSLSVDYRLTVGGFVVGTLVGMSGVGGSSVLAPLLILLFGFTSLATVGTDLVYSVPTKLFAWYLHSRNRTVDRSIVVALLVGGVPGALLGLLALVVLQSHVAPRVLNGILRHGIGYAILLACVGTGVMYVARRRRRTEMVADPLGRDVRWQLASAGFVVGFLVAITSVGSGSVTLPMLMLLLPGVALRRLIGSEIAFAALLIPLAALGHVTLGDVNWPACLALLLGSLPGVTIGSRLVTLVDERRLQPVVIATLAFAASRLI